MHLSLVCLTDQIRGTANVYTTHPEGSFIQDHLPQYLCPGIVLGDHAINKYFLEFIWPEGSVMIGS